VVDTAGNISVWDSFMTERKHWWHSRRRIRGRSDDRGGRYGEDL